MTDEPREPTAEELQALIRQLKVSDLLLQTLTTISSLGYAKLSPEGRDLEQAHLAIEAMRALLPVLEGAVPDQTRRNFGQVVANLQLAYASAVREAEASPPSNEGTAAESVEKADGSS